MAIIEDSSPVVTPERSTKIIRYLNITKLLSLLDSRALFLARMDKSEDKFEGRMLSLDTKYRDAAFYEMKRDGYKGHKTSSDFDKSMNEVYESVRKQAYINCWNNFDGESVAMWRIYSELGNGVAIVSDTTKLTEALVNTVPDLYLSAVRYVNQENDIIPEGNLIFPIITKQDAYKYENEIRLFHISYNQKFSEENPFGFCLPIDLEILITKIIIGPFTPKWVEDLISNLLIKYGVNKPLERSTLYV